jgi:uracil phosphoribosyltransferase
MTMPNTHVCSHPLVRVLVTRLRDRETHAAEFRALVGSITGFLLHDALADVPLAEAEVHTPLAPASGWRLARPVVFVPILRAGLGMSESVVHRVPGATVWHLGLFRDEDTLEPVVYYNKLSPSALANTITVVLDPMLATAGSLAVAVDALKDAGATDIRFIGLVAAPEGAAAMNERHPDVRLFVSALDERLTGQGEPWPAGYIVPGLGDAGDRQFGTT